MAGAGFGGPLLICLLNLTLNKKSSLHTITVRIEVSCLLRFTPATNSVAHTSQLRDGGLWSRIRKFVTQPAKENTQRTHREQTENSKPEATLIPVDSRGERANIVV